MYDGKKERRKNSVGTIVGTLCIHIGASVHQQLQYIITRLLVTTMLMRKQSRMDGLYYRSRTTTHLFRMKRRADVSTVVEQSPYSW